MTTLQFRHYHIGVVKRFLAQAIMKPENATSEWSHADTFDVIHQQAGYSSTKAQDVYSVSMIDKQHVSSAELGKFQATSFTCHEFLSLSTGTVAASKN